MRSVLSTTFPSSLPLHLHPSPRFQLLMKMQSSLSPSIRLAIFSVRDQRISQHDFGVVQDRREDKNLINGIFPRKALLKRNLSVSPNVNGVPARGRTSLLLRMQLVAAAPLARLLYLVYPTSSRLSTIPSRPARRMPTAPPASRVFQVFRVFRGWVHPMFVQAPRRRAYPLLHPWDHPVPADKHKHRRNHKDKDKAVSSEEEEGRFLVKMICFGIIMSPVDLQIGIGMVEEIEAGWIGIEIHEGGKTQEVIKCMVVDQGDRGGLLPDQGDKDQDQVKEDTITHLFLPTIPHTRLLPTTTTITTTTTHLVIHQRPTMLCLLDQVVHLNIILIIGLHRDLLKMAQVAKGIMALPHLVGMASTAAAAAAVVTVGMDGDKMKSISLNGRERERGGERGEEREKYASWLLYNNYLMCESLHAAHLPTSCSASNCYKTI